MQKNNTITKKYMLLIFAIIILVITYLFYIPIDLKSENRFKENYLYVLLFPLFVLLIKNKIYFIKNKKLNKYFIYFFIISLSIGIGIILKTFFVNLQISYLGLISVFISFPFLILSFNQK